jgi:hypothetical protein
MSPSLAFKTAIVPAAGLGTRFLPTTKAVPKELLPVVDTPGIELVAAEAADAGASRLVIVTSPGKDAVVEYFRPQPELEETLRARGKTALLEKVRRAPSLLKVETAIQEQALGLGHAVACAEAGRAGRPVHLRRRRALPARPGDLRRAQADHAGCRRRAPAHRRDRAADLGGRPRARGGSPWWTSRPGQSWWFPACRRGLRPR